MEERRSPNSIGARLRGENRGPGWGAWGPATAPGAASAAAPADTATGPPALRDPVTGLPNRVLLEDRLECALRRAQRSRQLLAVAIVGVDGYEDVRTREHSAGAGPELLAETARRLVQAVRAVDTVARLETGEFVLVFETLLTAEPASLLGLRLTAVTTEPCKLLVDADGTPAELAPRTTVGIALSPLHGKTVDELLRAAQSARSASGRHGGAARVYQGVAEDATTATR